MSSSSLPNSNKSAASKAMPEISAETETNSKALIATPAPNTLALSGLQVVVGSTNSVSYSSSDGGDIDSSNVAKSTEATLAKSSPSLIEKSNAKEKKERS